jgi:hypothetical protein
MIPGPLLVSFTETDCTITVDETVLVVVLKVELVYD